MEILNASEVKNNFGEVLLKAQQGPIGINKNGKLMKTDTMQCMTETAWQATVSQINRA